MPRDAGVTPAPSRLRLIEWKGITKNTLVGFATIELPNGLIVGDISVHQKNGRRWAGLPAKPQLDAHGQQLVDDAGKKKWVPILRWRDRALADEFGRRVIALVEAEHPDVFGG